MIIRRLTAKDAAIWRQIRLEGLAAYPDAFMTQVADVAARKDAELAEALTRTTILVAFDGREPIASMGYFIGELTAQRHRATIIAVYVRKTWQGKGVADALLQAVIDDLPSDVLQLHLEVAATNPRAEAFYRRHGFRRVGTIPRAILRDGVAVDDHMMVRMLDA